MASLSAAGATDAREDGDFNVYIGWKRYNAISAKKFLEDIIEATENLVADLNFIPRYIAKDDFLNRQTLATLNQTLQALDNPDRRAAYQQYLIDSAEQEAMQ